MADLFAWNSDLSVNVQTIDDQHKELLTQINGFLRAVIRGEGLEEVHSTIDFLVRYVDVHFLTEEYFMTKYEYPHYVSHKREHERLTAEILKAQGMIATEPTRDVVTQLVTRMGSWILEHVLKMDKAMGQFLQSLPGPLEPAVPDHLTAAINEIQATRVPEKKDSSCNYIESCSAMFNSFLDDECRIFWRKRFCLDSYGMEKCLRRKKLDACEGSEEVPKTMLPNGEHLRHLGS